MSFADAESAIRARFHGAWTGTPIADEDDSFDPQDSAATSPYAAGGPWVELAIEWVQAAQISMGAPSNVFRAEGLVTVNCFVPVNTGKDGLNALVDQAVAILQGKNFDGSSTTIRLRAGFPAKTMVDGQWFRTAATFRVQADALG